MTTLWHQYASHCPDSPEREDLIPAKKFVITVLHKATKQRPLKTPPYNMQSTHVGTRVSRDHVWKGNFQIDDPWFMHYVKSTKERRISSKFNCVLSDQDCTIHCSCFHPSMSPTLCQFRYDPSGYKG